MKISIITITYNSQDTVEETIKSVIGQDYDDLEYIIIDGKSEDNTMQIVNKYRDKINLIISEKDDGISDAFNKGINLSTGDIIGIINSDDILLPNSLKIISKQIKKNIDVIYGTGYRLFEDGTKKEYKIYPLEQLYNSMGLLHPAVFVKKKSYVKYGFFSTKYKANMDRDLLIRFYHNGAKFQFIDAKLALYRVGGYSEKDYFKYTIKESAEISFKYGMPILKVIYTYMRSYLRMKIIFFFKKIKFKKKNDC